MEDKIETRLPEMVGVKSSNVAAIGYMDGGLYVRYGQAIYVYEDVPQALYEGLMAAESKGGYLNASVKGRYKYRRL